MNLGTALIRAYQIGVPRRFKGNCTKTPHCSAYGLQAVREHGTRAGIRMAVQYARTGHRTEDCEQYAVTRQRSSRALSFVILMVAVMTAAISPGDCWEPKPGDCIRVPLDGADDCIGIANPDDCMNDIC